MKNIILFFIKFMLILRIESSKWQVTVHKKTENIPVSKFVPNHRKIPFGIIISQNSWFNVTIQNDKKAENLYFYCLDDSATGANHRVDFKGRANLIMSIKAEYDCVPVASVSYKVPVSMTVSAQKWKPLPVFVVLNNDNLYWSTMGGIQDFFQAIESYGFVENMYTQLLLTPRDVGVILAGDSTLTTTLWRYFEIVKFYNELFGDYDHQQSIIFLRTSSQTLISPKKSRNSDCSHFQFTNDWIVTTGNIFELLNDGEDHLKWCLLVQIGRFYEIKYFPNHLQVVGNVWSVLFAYLYRKYINHKELLPIPPVDEDQLKNTFRNAYSIEQWDLPLKVHFFKNLFDYKDMESTFREFNFQHVKNSNLGEFNDIVYTLIEVFLERHDLNIMGYLRRVHLTLMENTSPRRHFDDLKMRLLNAKDFVPSLYLHTDNSGMLTVEVQSPVDSLEGQCFYISGNCLKLAKVYDTTQSQSVAKFRVFFNIETANYYTMYFARKIGENLYFSEISSPFIFKSADYAVAIIEVTKGQIFLPLIYYYIDVICGNEELAVRALVNYKRFTIDVIFDDLDENVFYTLTLIRNGNTVYDSLHIGQSRKTNSRLVERIIFQINDTLIVEFQYPLCKIKINDYVEQNTGKNSALIVYALTDIGIKQLSGFALTADVVIRDVERLKNYRNRYKKCLTPNAYFNLALDHYGYLLCKTPFDKLVSSGCQSDQN